MIGINTGYGMNSLSGMNFDYRGQQARLKAALAAGSRTQTASDSATTTTSTSSVKVLKKETAEFLDSYTKNNTDMKQTADALVGTNLDKLLNGKAGSTPEQNVKDTVDAVQKMVDSYNKNLTNLNKNADRGSAVVRQIGRMARAPASKEAMELTGMKVNKDGTIALDKDKLTQALSGSDTKRDFTKSLISEIAQGVKSDATSGLNESPARVISNDLAKIQKLQQDQNPLNNSMGMYAKSGAYTMMNMGVVGILMNAIA